MGEVWDRITYLQQAKKRGKFSPLAVQTFAELMLKDDFGNPIRPATHHRLWLQLACDERIKKLLIISPPESAKTTWLLSAFLACWIGFYPETSNIIASVSDTVATNRSLSIRTLTQSKIWQTIFPDLQPVRSHWEQQAWSIAENGQATPGRIHRTLTAYGTGASIIGSRADMLVGDDLLDYDNTRTQHQRELVDEWLHNSFLSRRKSRVGRVILIGTSWNAADSYAVLRKGSQGWVICHTPLLSETDDGFSAFITYPDSWQYEKLGDPIGGVNASNL